MNTAMADPQARLDLSKRYLEQREKGLDTALLPLGNPRGKDVLVFGCGKGNEVLWCARHDAKSALGIDTGIIYPHALSALLSERGQHEFKWDMQQIDVQELALGRPGQFDLIVSNGVFEHVSDMRGVLSAFRRLLRPGGRVSIYADSLWYSAIGGHLGTANWEHLWMSEQEIKDAFPARWHAYKHNLNRMTCIDFMSALRDSAALIKQFNYRSDPYLANMPALLGKIQAKQPVSLTDLSITSIGCEFCFLETM